MSKSKRVLISKLKINDIVLVGRARCLVTKIKPLYLRWLSGSLSEFEWHYKQIKSLIRLTTTKSCMLK